MSKSVLTGDMCRSCHLGEYVVTRQERDPNRPIRLQWMQCNRCGHIGNSGRPTKSVLGYGSCELMQRELRAFEENTEGKKLSRTQREYAHYLRCNISDCIQSTVAVSAK